jgi:hypothetical protein
VDKQEKATLEDAREAWPEAMSLSAFDLQQVADALSRQGLLVRSKFCGDDQAYFITAAGRAALEETRANG